MLYLEHLLAPFGFSLQEAERRVKLVRHIDKRLDVWQLYRNGQLNDYQSIQSRPIFDGVDLVLAFLGREATHAVFAGAYRVGECVPADSNPLPDDSPVRAIVGAEDLRYRLELDNTYMSLHERVVIDWGKGVLAWHQRFKRASKEVVEVLPAGYVRAFPGHANVRVSFSELQRIVRHPVAHREWHRALAGVAAVYLILDTRSGSQYVGSAYGTNGLLGRWSDYARNGHGDNEQLRALLKADPQAAQHFQFAILQTLPLTLTPREVIDCEKLHKDKLGSRAHGLNSN